MDWVLMFKLHYRACSGRLSVWPWGSPSVGSGWIISTCRTGHSPSCITAVTPGMLGSHFAEERMFQCWHSLAAHPGQCVLVMSALHEGSWNCCGAPPELGLCTSAMSRQSRQPGISVQAVRDSTPPCALEGKVFSSLKTVPGYFYLHQQCALPRLALVLWCPIRILCSARGHREPWCLQTPYQHCWGSGCPEGESRLSMLIYN